MDKTQEIIEIFHRLLVKFQNREKRPNNFGTGELLYRFEIHVIDAIYRKPGINVSDLSIELMVTKGAISQVINKLEKKGYIQKAKDPVSNKIIYLTLTQKGEFVAVNHIKFHRKMIENFMKSTGTRSKEEIDTLLSFLKSIDSKL